MKFHIAVLELINRNGLYDILLARREDLPPIRDIDAHSLVSRISEEWLQDRHAHYKDRFFIARIPDTGEIIGYLTASHHLYYPSELPGYIYLSRFAVKEEYRRCRVGTALLIAIINHFKGLSDYRGLVADVRKSNKGSIRFFETRSFIRHDTLSRPDWYERGETPDDRYKVVLYYPFGMEDR
jgi:ribosomal protein S18 acetylase RimI-like enzyme